MLWLNYILISLASLLIKAWPKSLDPAVKFETWDPNYCNDTKAQETAGLTKTALGQFLGYACDNTFFQCRFSVEGWKTYKKFCRKGLVFDRAGTQNCNYDFNVEGCGMKQCADCIGEQYACCLSEECVDLGVRCDGKYDCSLEEDEQNCPTCSAGEFPCVISEQCIPIDKRCNGIKECKDGTDELHCDECDVDMFWCRNSKKCIEKELRCDGNRDCNAGEDETFCVITVQKEYMCENQQDSIPKKDVCNGFPDCPDGSDEMYCNGVGVEYEENNPNAGHGGTGNSNGTLPKISFPSVTTKPRTGRPTPAPAVHTNSSSVLHHSKMTTRFSPTLHGGSVTRTYPRITAKPMLMTPQPKTVNRRNEDYFYEE